MTIAVDRQVTQRSKQFVYIGVPSRSGGRTTISLKPKVYDEMCRLAHGRGQSCEARVAEVCRAVADKLIRARYAGAWSPEVRRRATSVLRGAFIPARTADDDEAAKG